MSEAGLPDGDPGNSTIRLPQVRHVSGPASLTHCSETTCLDELAFLVLVATGRWAVSLCSYSRSPHEALCVSKLSMPAPKLMQIC